MRTSLSFLLDWMNASIPEKASTSLVLHKHGLKAAYEFCWQLIEMTKEQRKQLREFGY